MNYRLKQVFKSFKPLYVYILIQVMVVFVAFYIDFLQSAGYMKTQFISISSENLIMTTIAGIMCIIIYRGKVTRIFGSSITKQLISVKFTLVLRLVIYSVLIRVAVILPALIIYFVNKNFADGFVLEANGTADVGISIVSACIVAPIVEEILFRGIIIKDLLDYVSFRTANILQAIVFALLHVGVLQMISSFMFGYFQGLLVQKYKSIGVTIILHIMYNSVAIFALLYKYLS